MHTNPQGSGFGAQMSCKMSKGAHLCCAVFARHVAGISQKIMGYYAVCSGVLVVEHGGSENVMGKNNLTFKSYQCNI